jgi:hypothetical protein
MRLYSDLKRYGARFLRSALPLSFAQVAITAAFLLPGATSAQSQWSVQGRYLARAGSPVFLRGANYIPSDGWLLILKNWNPAAVNRDMIALHNLGITSIRFPPLWPLLEPTPNGVDPIVLGHLSQLVTIAYRNGISVQVDPITGWMSGASFLPHWVHGNIFTDPSLVHSEELMASAVAHTLKNNPGLQGYDFGNEVNVLVGAMDLHVTQQQASDWMHTIYEAFHREDPHHPVTNGVGDFSGSFDIGAIAANADFMSVHYYPYFASTARQDPWIGQRTTYGVDYLVAYAAMTGKPVLVQEIGVSQDWMPSLEIPKYLRLTLMSTWAEGAAGYFWWGSNDISQADHSPARYVDLSHSTDTFAHGDFPPLEYGLGLLTTRDQPKPDALEYARWNEVIRQLGMGWKNDLPVAYILYPNHAKGSVARMNTMTAFTLAKQAHLEVRMWPEDKPIPGDAASVIIAGFSLSDEGKATVTSYLHRNGVVYQSEDCDFPQILSVSGVTSQADPMFVATQADGMFSIGQHIRVNAPLQLTDASPVSGQQVTMLLGLPAPESPDAPLHSQVPSRGILFRAALDGGTYYYLAANLEQALASTYNPWQEDDSNLIYSVLNPAAPIGIDSKYVELEAKSRGSQRLLLLLNHSNRFQDVVLRSAIRLHLENYITHASLGDGTEIPIRLMPGEVLVATER